MLTARELDDNVEPGRTDLQFSLAGRVKQTLTPRSDKTDSGIRLYTASTLW